MGNGDWLADELQSMVLAEGLWSSSIWVPVGLGITVLAALAGWLFAWWYARGPQLLMRASGTTIISAPDDHNRIKVLFDDVAVDRVTQSVVWLWRRGRGVVKRDDIVPTDPIVISVPEGSSILDASLIKQSKATNNFQYKRIDDARYQIEFDYLDARQGAILEIFHTGDEPDGILISGTILGIPKGIKVVRDAEIIPGLPLAVAGVKVVTYSGPSVPWHLRFRETEPNLWRLVLSILKVVVRRVIPF